MRYLVPETNSNHYTKPRSLHHHYARRPYISTAEAHFEDIKVDKKKEEISFGSALQLLSSVCRRIIRDLIPLQLYSIHVGEIVEI